jgi:hypothetical protein
LRDERVSAGRDFLPNAGLHARERRFQFLHPGEQFRQHPALHLSEAPGQRAPELGLFTLQLPLGQLRQLSHVLLSLRQGAEHQPPTEAQDVTGYLPQLDIRALDQFLDPIGYRRVFDHQCLPVPDQLSHLPDLQGRNKTRFQQAVP